MRSRSSKTRSRTAAHPPPNVASNSSVYSIAQQQDNCYEGERLAYVLESIQREIESVRLLDRGGIPEKLWLKQQFAVGVNEVTRVLERMPLISDSDCSPPTDNYNSNNIDNKNRDDKKALSDKLQAILIALDCSPRWLTKHLLMGLASSRGVPLIFVKDMKGGSLRLGELVKLKTAIAVGIKARGNTINQFVDKILVGSETRVGLKS